MRIPARLLAPVAPLLAANLGLLAVFDLGRHLALTLILAGVGFAALPFAVRRLEAADARHDSSGAPIRSRSVGAAVLAGALLLRLPLLAVPPTLSDDVLRYLWDGKVLAAGRNPYALAPEAPELAPLRRETGGLPPHGQVPTIYPPLALAGFSIAAHLPFPILSWKLLATAADLGGCALLIRLARRLGFPAGRAAWYAWNPLVAIEVAGMGHVDALGVAAAIAAVSLLRLPGEAAPAPPAPESPAAASPASRRAGIAGMAGVAGIAGMAGMAGFAGLWAAIAALVKLGPLAAFPMWSRQSGRPLAFLAAALGLTLAAGLPVLAATGGVPPALVRYGMTWEFDGPLFEPLWRLLDRAGAASALARALDAWKARSGEWYAWNWLYPYLYPQLLAKVALGIGMLAALAASLSRRRPVEGTGRLFGSLLLLSATLYPWYLLWVLPWAALARHRAWLALSALILLSYLADAREVLVWPWIYLAIWVPFFLLLAAERQARRWQAL